MAAIASQQPSTFNYFAAAQQRKPQVFPLNLSPQSPYAYAFDTQADYSNDSAPSPGSPLSLVFTNPYQLPSADDDWLAWDGKVLTPNSDAVPKLEPYDSPLLPAALPRYVSVSPAINPLELSASAADDVAVAFGRGGLADTQPLFQSPPSKPMPSRQQQDVPMTSATTEARYASRKRKSTCSASSRSSASPPPSQQPLRRPVQASLPQKKTTHNVIEKRYRTNLNDKIAALRDAVPSLRVMARQLEHPHSSDDANEELDCGEDLGGLTPAHKLNKATVLSKATEYISHLEKQNKNLARENQTLRDRVEGFEMLVMSRGRPGAGWN